MNEYLENTQEKNKLPEPVILQTGYGTDEEGHYTGIIMVQPDPLGDGLLIPDNCVLFAPDKEQLKTSWAVLNKDKTAWGYVKKPTTAEECLNIVISHDDNCDYANEMRSLMQSLCDKDSEHYRVARGDDLSWYVEKIPEKSFEELQTEKHNSLKGTMRTKRQSLKVDYDDDQFDANETAQANMNTLLQAFNLGATSVSIRSANEVTHTFNQTHCNELALLMADAVNKLYAEYWKYKDALAKCKTVDAVNEIKWG